MNSESDTIYVVLNTKATHDTAFILLVTNDKDAAIRSGNVNFYSSNPDALIIERWKNGSYDGVMRRQTRTITVWE